MTKLPSGSYVDLTGRFCLVLTQGLSFHSPPVWMIGIEGFDKTITLAAEDVDFVKKIAEARIEESKGTTK